MAGNKKLLLFNMNEDKAALIKSLCAGMGIRIVKIYKHQYGEKIGALAGIPTFAMKNLPYRGDDFSQEMMVICGLNSRDLDEFLQAYRDAKIQPVRLKAALTPHNMQWSAAMLYNELAQEDASIHNSNQNGLPSK